MEPQAYQSHKKGGEERLGRINVVNKLQRNKQISKNDKSKSQLVYLQWKCTNKLYEQREVTRKVEFVRQSDVLTAKLELPDSTIEWIDS